MQAREYIFKHALTQEVSYETLLLAHRKELHRRAGEALEALSPEKRDERAGVIGQHFAKAELPEKALVYLRCAGDQAAKAYANVEALAFYRQALEQISLADAGGAKSEEQAEELHERSGDLLELIGKPDAAREAYADASASGARLATSVRARLFRKKAKTYEMQRRFDEAFLDYARAEQTLGDPECFGSVEWGEWIDIGLERSWAYYFQNRVEEMDRELAAIRGQVNVWGTRRQQSAMAERVVLMRSRRERALPSDETVQLAWRSLESWEAVGDLLQIGHARFLIGLAYVCRREAVLAEEQLRAAEAISDRTGDLVLLSRAVTYLVLAARWKSDVPAARAEADRLMAIATQHGMREYTAMVHATRAWIAYREEDLPLAQREAGQALELWKQVVYPFHWTALWPLIAIAIQHGDAADAIGYAKKLLLPTQQALPAELDAFTTSAISEHDAGREKGALRLMTCALRLARELAYL